MIEENQIDKFLFHQGSKYMIEALVKRMELAPDKVIFGASQYGNTVSSSIPILLNDVINDKDDSKNIVISGFGVGLSWSSTILKKIKYT